MGVKSFEYQPDLKGPNVRLQAIGPDDFDGLYRCASNPLVWAGHPAKDRHHKEVFQKWFENALAEQALVLARRADNRVMGSSRYYTVDTAPGDIAIGYTFLGIEFWGGAVNQELKALMLNHAFTTYDNVWFHIDRSNLRSQAAIKKIGALFVRDEVNSLSVEGSIWKCYRISKESWLARPLS